jgi:hypothetical protein
VNLGTGRTVYDVIFSLDSNNNPVTATTFNIDVYRNGMSETGVTVNMSLTDASTGAFTSSWTASTTGDYQLYYKNSATNVVFVTETYNILPDDEIGTNVYVGL